MAECVVCGDTSYTRRCSYCGDPVCTDHTLPERHDCTGQPDASDGRHLESGHDLLGDEHQHRNAQRPEPMEVPEDGVYRTSEDYEPEPHEPVYNSAGSSESSGWISLPTLPEYWWSDVRAQLFVVLRWMLRGVVLAGLLVLTYIGLTGGF